MFCPNCGTQVPEGSKFCPKCGAAVASAEKASGGVAPGDAGGVTGTAPQPAGKGPKVSRRAFVIGGVAAAAAVAGIALAAGGGNGSAGGGLAGIGGTPVRDSADDYSWDELSQIADQIAKASSDDDGLDVAKKYHLCGDDGKLDGTQLKSFELADGTKAQAQVIGFRHDDRADGSGKAGITFITKDCVARHEMNGSDDNSGGWEECSLRSWMGSDLLDMFPEDLSSKIVSVSKTTNNVGQTTEASAATATEDSLWLLSSVELVGEGQLDPDTEGSWIQDYFSLLTAEGTQYQLYADESVREGEGNSNDVLLKECYGEESSWWERSPDPMTPASFDVTDVSGYPNYAVGASESRGVAPCFCL